ncbi:phosphatidylglycerol lysyltransferase domain-containing protein, partial [Rhodococcus erythropolis]|nr:phosphatidylglycerol lysyltransferase domain-containing protein [Rhodococcus erythropolis]
RRKIRGGPLSGNDPRATARELLKQHGGGTMSWMTTWDGNSYYFGESGESVVAFQRHVGVVVVLADPI